MPVASLTVERKVVPGDQGRLSGLLRELRSRATRRHAASRLHLRPDRGRCLSNGLDDNKPLVEHRGVGELGEGIGASGGYRPDR